MEPGSDDLSDLDGIPCDPVGMLDRVGIPLVFVAFPYDLAPAATHHLEVLDPVYGCLSRGSQAGAHRQETGSLMQRCCQTGTQEAGSCWESHVYSLYYLKYNQKYTKH